MAEFDLILCKNSAQWIMEHYLNIFLHMKDNYAHYIYIYIFIYYGSILCVDIAIYIVKKVPFFFDL